MYITSCISYSVVKVTLHKITTTVLVLLIIFNYGSMILCCVVNPERWYLPTYIQQSNHIYAALAMNRLKILTTDWILFPLLFTSLLLFSEFFVFKIRSMFLKKTFWWILLSSQLFFETIKTRKTEKLFFLFHNGVYNLFCSFIALVEKKP